MARWLLVVCALALCPAAGGPLAQAQQREQGCTASNVAAGTTIACTINGVTAGRLIVCSVVNLTTGGTPGTTTFSSSPSNTWANVRTDVVLDAARLTTGYAANVASGNTTITATFTASSTNRDLHCHEVSGLATTSPLDQHNGNMADSGTTANSGNITTTQAAEYLYGRVVIDSTAAVTTGNDFTEGANTTSGAIRGVSSDRTVSSTGTYSAEWTWTGAVAWIAQVVSFRAETAEPPARRRRGLVIIAD